MRRYWTLNEAEARAWQVPLQALPSDARERADLVALASGNLKAAQVPARLDALQPLQLYTKFKGNTLLLRFEGCIPCGSCVPERCAFFPGSEHTACSLRIVALMSGFGIRVAVG